MTLDQYREQDQSHNKDESDSENVLKSKKSNKKAYVGSSVIRNRIPRVATVSLSTCDDIQVEITDFTFPVFTVTNEFYVIDTTNSQSGPTLLVEKDNIISLTVLLKTDFKVEFVVGRTDDSFFDGILYTPMGILINLVFHDNL